MSMESSHQDVSDGGSVGRGNFKNNRGESAYNKTLTDISELNRVSLMAKYYHIGTKYPKEKIEVGVTKDIFC